MVEVKEERREINTTALAVGGAVIAVCGLGAYYIYSRNALLDRLREQVEEYMRKYYEFAESDGGIDEGEQEALDVEKQGIDTTVHVITDQGLVGDAIELLWTIGIVVAILYAAGIIAEIVRRYFRHNPRDPDTGDPVPDPSKPYKDVIDETWHPTEDHLVDHYRDVHPTPGTDPDAWDDVWRDIRGLPQWVISLLSAFNLDGLEEWVEHDYHELDPNTQLTIKLLIGIAFIILCALIGWYAPSILGKAKLILGKLDKIPTPA